MMTEEHRKRLRERVLNEAQVDAIMEVSGHVCFVQNVPRLVSILSDKQLIYLVENFCGRCRGP